MTRLVYHHHLVHQLPGLLDGLPVDLQPRWGHRGREGPMEPREQVVWEVPGSRRHHPLHLLLTGCPQRSKFSLSWSPHLPLCEKFCAVLKLDHCWPDDDGVSSCAGCSSRCPSSSWAFGRVAAAQSPPPPPPAPAAAAHHSSPTSPNSSSPTLILVLILFACLSSTFSCFFF